MMLPLRLLGFLLLNTGKAKAQNYAFCTDGIAQANFDEHESIDVIVAQAPLFSTNRKVGKLFGLIQSYHSSLLFAQGSGTSRRYWTLEFDNTAPSFLDGVVPTFESNGSAHGRVSFLWHNDARYCLSGGLKWGLDHWSQRFDIVTSISADQAKHAFKDFLSVVNVTQQGVRPQYQLWRVATADLVGRIKKTLIADTTCNDGVVWFLHYLKSELHATFADDFVFKGTIVLFKAKRVEKVNIEDPAQLEEMLVYWRRLRDMTSAHKPLLGRLSDLVKFALHRKYVYDNNAGVFYRLFGWQTWFPWPHYIEMPLVAPPLARSSSAIREGVVV